MNRRVAGSIPSQGTCLGCGPGPQEGTLERQPHTDVSLPLFLPPFTCLKIISKIFKKINTKKYHSVPSIVLGIMDIYNEVQNPSDPCTGHFKNKMEQSLRGCHIECYESC